MVVIENVEFKLSSNGWEARSIETGRCYDLLEGVGTGADGRRYSSDIIFIFDWKQNTEAESAECKTNLVNYIFGADTIYSDEYRNDLFAGIAGYIHDYEKAKKYLD